MPILNLFSPAGNYELIRLLDKFKDFSGNKLDPKEPLPPREAEATQEGQAEPPTRGTGLPVHPRCHRQGRDGEFGVAWKKRARWYERNREIQIALIKPDFTMFSPAWPKMACWRRRCSPCRRPQLPAVQGHWRRHWLWVMPNLGRHRTILLHFQHPKNSVQFLWRERVVSSSLVGQLRWSVAPPRCRPISYQQPLEVHGKAEFATRPLSYTL